MKDQIHTECAPSGTPPSAGALFGLVTDPILGIVFVDDATNTPNELQ
jgi:hypothetical protein